MGGSRNLLNLEDGELRFETMGRRGLLGLCILGRP